MLTEALSTAVTVCRKQMIHGCVAYPSYDVQDSCAPWERNVVFDNVVGTLGYAVVTNVKDLEACE